jgi:3'(2'), 5'-bisphosphate nucleotidase/myo-inositol-1(or 4)-monophosphatase
VIADECLRGELLRLADIPIVSEEDVASQSSHRPTEYWLIDPIDGTASFASGYDGFVCQAAWMRDGHPWLAAVYAPALERLYLAERNRGAMVNGRPIAVKLVDMRQLTLVDNYPEPRGVAKRLFRDLHFSKYLESGSIGLKICLVAEGTADVFVKDVTVKDWDIAAPHLVLQEAGGVLTQFAGQTFEFQAGYEKNGLVVTSSGPLLREVSEVVSTYGRET